MSIFQTSKQKAKKETEAIYKEALKRHKALRKEGGLDDDAPMWVLFGNDVLDSCRYEFDNDVSYWNEGMNFAWEMAHAEPFFPEEIPEPPANPDSIEGGRWRDEVNRLTVLMGDKATRNVATELTARVLNKFIYEIPESSGGDYLADAPLYEVSDGVELVGMMATCLFNDEIKSKGLYKSIRNQILSNFEEVQEAHRSKEFVYPDEYKGDNLAYDYLHDTPFYELATYEVSMHVPEHIRYEHTAIVGGSGHGKTTLLQQMILNDIVKLKEGRGGGFAVIDPKGSLIDSISHLAIFSPDGGALADKIVIIDPRQDLQHPPCLNMFDLGMDELGQISEADRMGIKNNALDLIDYMFSDLLRVETTGRQEVAFKYVGELMVNIPGSNIMTFLDFLNNPEEYTDYINKLPNTARDYITKQFIDVRFDTTRKALAERVYAVLQLPMMEQMLDNKKNKVNLNEAINEGKIILIKADENFLSTNGSMLFGGIWIALMFQAALARTTIPRDQRRGFTLYIDEASMYFSDRLRQLLIKAREFKLGAVFAFQDLEQIESRQMRASVMGSTSTKMVGGLNAGDRRAFAQEMNTTEDFLKTPKKNEEQKRTEFATFIRGVIEKPMITSYELGLMSQIDRMSDAEFQQLVALNRSKISRSDDDYIEEVVEEYADPDPVIEETPEPEPEVEEPKKKTTRWNTVDYSED